MQFPVPDPNHYSDQMAKVYAKKVSTPQQSYKHLMFQHYHRRFWGRHQQSFLDEVHHFQESVHSSLDVSGHNQSMSVPIIQTSFLRNLDRLGDTSEQLAREIQSRKRRSQREEAQEVRGPSILQDVYEEQKQERVVSAKKETILETHKKAEKKSEQVKRQVEQRKPQKNNEYEKLRQQLKKLQPPKVEQSKKQAPQPQQQAPEIKPKIEPETSQSQKAQQKQTKAFKESPQFQPILADLKLEQQHQTQPPLQAQNKARNSSKEQAKNSLPIRKEQERETEPKIGKRPDPKEQIPAQKQPYSEQEESDQEQEVDQDSGVNYYSMQQDTNLSSPPAANPTTHNFMASIQPKRQVTAEKVLDNSDQADENQEQFRQITNRLMEQIDDREEEDNRYFELEATLVERQSRINQLEKLVEQLRLKEDTWLQEKREMELTHKEEKKELNRKIIDLEAEVKQAAERSGLSPAKPIRKKSQEVVGSQEFIHHEEEVGDQASSESQSRKNSSEFSNNKQAESESSQQGESKQVPIHRNSIEQGLQKPESKDDSGQLQWQEEKLAASSPKSSSQKDQQEQTSQKVPVQASSERDESSSDSESSESRKNSSQMSGGRRSRSSSSSSSQSRPSYSHKSQRQESESQSEPEETQAAHDSEPVAEVVEQARLDKNESIEDASDNQKEPVKESGSQHSKAAPKAQESATEAAPDKSFTEEKQQPNSKEDEAGLQEDGTVSQQSSIVRLKSGLSAGQSQLPPLEPVQKQPQLLTQKSQDVFSSPQLNPTAPSHLSQPSPAQTSHDQLLPSQ